MIKELWCTCTYTQILLDTDGDRRVSHDEILEVATTMLSQLGVRQGATGPRSVHLDPELLPELEEVNHLLYSQTVSGAILSGS